MDTSQGHGDVLVGFAAHVEQAGHGASHHLQSLAGFVATQIPLDVWARGIKHESLGGGAISQMIRCCCVAFVLCLLQLPRNFNVKLKIIWQ